MLVLKIIFNQGLILKAYIAIFIIFSFTSCAAWRTKDFNSVTPYPSKAESDYKKPQVSINFRTYDVLDNGELDKAQMSKTEKKQVYDIITSSYKDSELFILVDDDSPNKELTIEVSIVRQNSSSLTMSILTALSLYLIPKRTTEVITISTKFFDKSDALIGMVEKTDSVVVWHQFFMLFAMPFSAPWSVKDETLTQLNKSTIVEASSDGLFVDINE